MVLVEHLLVHLPVVMLVEHLLLHQIAHQLKVILV
jgi:hypothetical protein